MLRTYCCGFCVFALLLSGPMLNADEPEGGRRRITRPIELNTPEADAIVAELKVFPANNPWNTKITDWPLHKNSDAMIESIGADKPMRYNPDMAYIIVPPNQPKVDVKLGEMAEESDKGPYPVPDNLPIEGWPAYFEREQSDKTLEQVQEGAGDDENDRHAIVLDPTNKRLYEFYKMRKNNGEWEADGAAIFDLSSNRLRPAGWTSADAAGLPIFPAVVRYDELQRGEIKHALRVTISRSRKAHVYPATHDASKLVDENLPRMGERLRLRKDFDTSNFSPEVETILVALQEYGMFVADNGIDWAISVAPDPRIPDLHNELRSIKGSAFEVVTAPRGYKKPR